MPVGATTCAVIVPGQVWFCGQPAAGIIVFPYWNRTKCRNEEPCPRVFAWIMAESQRQNDEWRSGSTIARFW